MCPLVLGNPRQTWILDSTLWIPDSRRGYQGLCQWNLDSGFQSLVGFWIPYVYIIKLYSGFQSPGLQIPQAKNARILESRFPSIGWSCAYFAYIIYILLWPFTRICSKKNWWEPLTLAKYNPRSCDRFRRHGDLIRKIVAKLATREKLKKRKRWSIVWIVLKWLTLYSSLATVVAWPTLARRPLEWPKKNHFYRVTLLVSFLGQNAELLDPPIRRKIKAPLGFYSVTSAHAVELFWIF